MKRILIALLIVCSSAIATAQTTAPATTRVAAQAADVPAPKLGKDGKPNADFMAKHTKYIERAKEGNIDLLFMGDSITAGWASKGKDVWQERYGNRNAANFGIGGDRTQHVLWRAMDGELENVHPKVVVLMIGTNNSNSDPADQIAAGSEAAFSPVAGGAAAGAWADAESGSVTAKATATSAATE
jgi:lysophospholipase L1-like esterase